MCEDCGMPDIICDCSVRRPPPVETVTSQAKHYTTYWVGVGPDGKRAVCELRVTPIGSLNTHPDSFWMLLAYNLRVQYPITQRGEVWASLLQIRPEELANL